MKRILVLSVIALISYPTFAQHKQVKTTHYRVTYGIKAGATVANVSVSEGSAPSPITSLYVGGTVNIPVHSVFSVQSGLTLIGKGFNRFESQALSVVGSTVIGSLNKSYRSTPWYLEMPVNAIVSLGAGPGKLFLGAGPYLGIGLFGKQELTMTGKTLGSTTSVNSQIADIKYSGTDKTLNTFDFGLNFLIGYQLLNGFSVHMGYGLGLTNVRPGAADVQAVKNSVFTAGLGFTFY
ncbi:MAG: porin family protein [Sphingobacteriaceae bacterium]|nr:MAG: PorT family protein [Pedobacter sp.]